MTNSAGYWSLAAAALVASPAAAQQSPPASTDIVVTGRGMKAPPGDSAYDIATFDRAAIEASPSNRLEDVLRSVAGLQQFRRSDSRSAHPTSQGISLRGLGGNASSRALLILDGVPQADPFGGWVAFTAYALDRLSGVRVQRGGGSGYAGPGALAGTVELESMGAADAVPLTGEVASGSRASLDANASAALIRASGFATLSAAYARGDGFVPVVREDRGAADRAAPYESMSAAVRPVVAVDDATEIQASVSAFADRRTRGIAFTDIASDGADMSIRLVGRGRLPWAALAYVQTRAFASGFASVDAARTTATATLDQYNAPATGFGGRIEIAPRLGDHVTLRIGADMRALSGRTQELFTYVAGQPTRRREAGGRTRTIGGFADASVEAGQLTLSLGTRVDRWDITGGYLTEAALTGGSLVSDIAFPDRNGSEATGRAGLAWRASPWVSLRTAVYRGWRLPTLNELYRPFRVGPDATAANALLSPERLWGYEAGVDLTPAPGVTISVTAFDNRLEGAIANVSVARGPGNFPGVGFVSAAGVYRARQNLSELRSRGIEIDAAASWRDFSARASYAFTDARIDDPALPGLRPAQTPRHQASATLGWRDAVGHALSFTARHAGRQFEDDQNTRSLAPATTVDVRAAMPIGAVTVEARAENLTDARIEAGISPDGAVERASPRTLWIGARFTLR